MPRVNHRDDAETAAHEARAAGERALAHAKAAWAFIATHPGYTPLQLENLAACLFAAREAEAHATIAAWAWAETLSNPARSLGTATAAKAAEINRGEALEAARSAENAFNRVRSGS